MLIFCNKVGTHFAVRWGFCSGSRCTIVYLHSFVLIFWCCEIVTKVQVIAFMAIFPTPKQFSCEKEAMFFSSKKKLWYCSFHQPMGSKLWYCSFHRPMGKKLHIILAFSPTNEKDYIDIVVLPTNMEKTHIAPCRANRDHRELFKTICSTRTLCLWDNMLNVIIFDII